MDWVDGNRYISFDTCKQLSKVRGYKYFGTQTVQADDSIICFGSNALPLATQYGLSTQCTVDHQGRKAGTNMCNFIYKQMR